MIEELKCPNCQQKNREIVILKSELAQARYVLNRIFDMAERNNGVVHFSNDDIVWQISIDDTDNNVGSIK